MIEAADAAGARAAPLASSYYYVVLVAVLETVAAAGTTALRRRRRITSTGIPRISRLFWQALYSLENTRKT